MPNGKLSLEDPKGREKDSGGRTRGARTAARKEDEQGTQEEKDMVPEKDSEKAAKAKAFTTLTSWVDGGVTSSNGGGSDWTSNWQPDDWAPPGLKYLASLGQKPVSTNNRFAPSAIRPNRPSKYRHQCTYVPRRKS